MPYKKGETIQTVNFTLAVDPQQSNHVLKEYITGEKVKMI